MNRASGVPKINSIGVKFKIDIGEDITLATTKNLIFLKPDGSIVTMAGTIEDLVYLTYETVLAADGTTLLDQAGLWRVTAKIVLPTFTGYGDACEFFVEGEFE
jgi:hypothetical protein